MALNTFCMGVSVNGKPAVSKTVTVGSNPTTPAQKVPGESVDLKNG